MDPIKHFFKLELQYIFLSGVAGLALLVLYDEITAIKAFAIFFIVMQPFLIYEIIDEYKTIQKKPLKMVNLYKISSALLLLAIMYYLGGIARTASSEIWIWSYRAFAGFCITSALLLLGSILIKKH